MALILLLGCTSQLLLGWTSQSEMKCHYCENFLKLPYNVLLLTKLEKKEGSTRASKGKKLNLLTLDSKSHVDQVIRFQIRFQPEGPEIIGSIFYFWLQSAMLWSWFCLSSMWIRFRKDPHSFWNRIQKKKKR